MRHRGPDGAGSYVLGNLGLGHRRLSIIDIEGGSQPLTNEDNSLYVIFNGEIYNYIELREELEKKGHRQASLLHHAGQSIPVWIRNKVSACGPGVSSRG